MDLRPDVVAGKYDPAIFDATGKSLLVNEIFYSLQGEGAHAGEACIFIRLAKCNLACKFCDTEFETFRKMTIPEIMEQCLTFARETHYRPHVTLTGGEPVLQNCSDLVRALKAEDFYVSVETSGSVWADWVADVNWVTCSPKVGIMRIPEALMERIDEFKWIVNATFLKMIEHTFAQCWVPGDVLNFLQPEWGPNREKYTAACVKLIQRYPAIYRLSLQQHKLINVP